MKADTQWARFQVFLQEAEGKPHQDVGSVHAPDAELALLNARDVFARRPTCISMWVAPADAIFSKTAEELEGWEPGQEKMDESSRTTFYIFSKLKASGTQTLIGTIEANSPQEALTSAQQKYSEYETHFAWWVIPESRITKSDIKDKSSFFDPAMNKEFRLSKDFKTHTAMRRIKQSKDEENQHTL